MDKLTVIGIILSIVGVVVSTLGVALAVLIYWKQNKNTENEKKEQQRVGYMMELKSVLHDIQIIQDNKFGEKLLFSETRYEIINYIRQIKSDFYQMKTHYFYLLEKNNLEIYKEIQKCISDFEIAIQEVEENDDIMNDFIYHNFPTLGISNSDNYNEYKVCVDVIDNIILREINPINVKVINLLND